MNTTNKIRSTKNIFLFGLIVLIGIGIITTVLFAQKRTNTRQNAAASTTLSFSPAAVNASIGIATSADIMLDPGSNQVSILKLVVSYDGSVFDQNTANLAANLINPSNLNAQGFIQLLQPFSNSCNGTSCTMSLTESIGSSPNLVITQPLKVGTLTLNPIAQTTGAGTSVAIDPTSAVYSLAPSDQTNENVIQFSSLTPLSVTVGAAGSITPTPLPSSITPTPPACVPNMETCAWDPLAGAANYSYTITDLTTGNVIAQSTIPSSQTSVQFSSTLGDTYQCSVTVVNSCQSTGSVASVTNTCSVSPTPTPTISPTATPTPTPTNTPTPGPTATPIQVSCNNSCNQNSDCMSGLICTGGSCRNPSCSTQSNCQCPPPPTQVIVVTQPPQIIVVTQPALVIVVTQPPKIVKLPPTGPVGDVLVRVGEVGGVIAIVGGLLVAFGL